MSSSDILQRPLLELGSKHSVTAMSIFAVMSGLAQQCNAINLSQGFPDFPIDQRLADLLGEAASQGFNQYAPMPGLPMLRNAIAADLLKRYGVAVDADTELTVVPGSTYGIYTAFTAVLQPGDEAIILEPAYDSYLPSIEMNGAKAVPVPLSAPTFHVDWDRVKDAVTSKTRAIIINTPHNPTGAIWTKADWDSLAAVVRDTNIIVLSDEVYEQMVFDGQQHYSVLQHAELRERSFALFSFGKVFNNTGWKLGYTVAPAHFTTAFRRLHQFEVFAVNTPAQYATAKYLENSDAPPVYTTMQQKRDHFLSLIGQTPFTIYEPAKGAYFQIAGYDRINDMPDKEFCQWLTREYGVATIPVSAFYKSGKDDRLIRFCFAKKEETLNEAIRRLSALPSR